MVAALAAAGVACGFASAAVSAPTLEDYGRLPTVSEVEISPDGAQLALIVGDATHRELQVRKTADHKLVFGVGLGAVKVRGLQWAGPRHVLIISSVATQVTELEGPKREYDLAHDLDLDTRKIHGLLNDAENALNTIESTPIVIDVKGRPTVFVEGMYFPGAQGVLALYKVDLKTHDSVRVTEGEVDTEGFVLGADGEPVARDDYNQHSGRWRLMVRHGGGWRQVYEETALIDRPELEGLGRGGRSVLVDLHGADGWGVHEVSLDTGGLSGEIQALSGREAVQDPRTHATIGGARALDDHTDYAFLDPADQHAWDSVAKAFPKAQVALSSWSDDRRHIVVAVEGGEQGAAYFVVDLDKGTADWLVDEYAGIEAEFVAEQRMIRYAAADGLEIPAYLTLPRDRPAKALPLIVLVHGGPAARDDPGFDWWAQGLASRGYAVLQPQFRGSSGFKEDLLTAGYGEWGRKMQTDLSDGVRALAKLGEIDPKRVCIMGASYGGYAALAGAVFDPASYVCAVDAEGVADLRRFLDYVDDKGNGQSDSSQRFWDRFMGAKSRHDPILAALSPALHADKAAMPILLIHGKEDTVVPYDQSREMADALKRAGKPFEFVTLKDEDHWLSHSATRLQLLMAAVAFVEKYAPPDKAPAAPATRKAGP